MSRKKSSQKKENPFVWVEIDLNNLRKNFHILNALAKRSGADVMAIVKAEAYGHGMVPVARALRQEGVRFFGVATLEEALKLREALPTVNILVLGSFHGDQVAQYLRFGIRPTISSLEDLRVFERNLRGRRAAVHVKVDTGMGRLGVWHGEAPHLFKEIARSKSIQLEGVYTHFSSAGDKEPSFTKLQMRRFEETLKGLSALGLRPRYIHAANSLGMTRFKHPRMNLVRPGILLYGLEPGSGGTLPRDLKPVMSLKARISFLKNVPAGQPLSYGRTYKTSKATRIATVPVGYSHGYRVGLSNKAFVAVKGLRCPVVGRVTMDQTLVDVGKVPGVRRWDVVTLLGRDGKSRITAEELAKTLHTIPYEIVCGIHSRIPRIYKGLKHQKS